MRVLPIVLILLLSITGCSVVPVGLADSSSPIQDGDGNMRSYEIVGHSEGAHGAFSLFGFIPMGHADLELAIDDATSKLGGDAMVNVRYWYRTTYAVVGMYSSVEVEGDVIRFVGEGGAR